MKYQVKATQVICKFFAVEAENEPEALEKAQAMAEGGELRFDDELFLNMEVNVELLEQTD
ncbi:MAG: hypothetical protein SPL42_00160 [Bacteroidales bacterium]|nr:hypothetical protein [Bacteroidales bacterium]MDY6346832.1 hypothetical protein [Bacteroidales bacterium]